jgi:uncharacterized integral membrane protein
MKRLLAVLIFGPLAILLVVLAVANRAPVRLSIDPFNPGSDALSIDLPLFFVAFAALAVGVILGGLAVWLNQGRYRRSARREHNAAVRWQRQAERAEARGEQTAPASTSSGPALPAPAGLPAIGRHAA